MMIYCSLEPGLTSLENLEPHDTKTAFKILESLFAHKERIRALKVRIPVTGSYIQRVLEGLNRVPISNPPIQKSFREYLLELLANQVRPALIPTGVTDGCLRPDIASDWVDDLTKQLWIDCLAASIAEGFHSSNHEDENVLTIATWSRDGLPREVAFLSSQIATFLDIESGYWGIPLLVFDYDWTILHSTYRPWPQNLGALIENYARTMLGVAESDLSKRRKFRFEDPCLRDLSQEMDTEVKRMIVEVMSRRAYDCLLPRDHDENVENFRRVYVKKMNPPIRLHYYFDQDEIVYTLYSNNDHDRGLR